MKTLRLVLWIAVALVAGLLGWLTLEATRTKEQVAGGPFGVPFELVAQGGKPITEKAFTGKPSALFFGFTHCPEVCPTTLFELDGWLAKVDPAGDKLQAYFVTIDPERDTVDTMRAYLANFDPRIVGLTGSPEAVAAALQAYRVFKRIVPRQDGGYDLDHTAPIYLMDRNGQFEDVVRPEDEGASQLVVAKLRDLGRA